MELAAVIISAILGWRHAVLGRRELQVMALVVIGWTAVTTAASIPYLTIEGMALSLVFHAAAVAIPYILAMWLRHILRR